MATPGKTRTQKKRYTSVEEQVEYAVAKVSAAETVRIPLKDFMFVFETLGELRRFFHQPQHWTSLVDVERFMGNVDEGAVRLVAESYRRLGDILPAEVLRLMDDGELDNPIPPYYFAQEHPKPPGRVSKAKGSRKQHESRRP